MNNIFYNNGFVSLFQGSGSIGTLRDIINYFHTDGGTFPESLLKYFTLELIIGIQKLHQCNIIHAAINVDNIFFFNFNSIPNINLLGVGTQHLRLIDFSNAIDMTLLPEGTVFNENFTKDPFFSVLNSKSWTYSV